MIGTFSLHNLRLLLSSLNAIDLSRHDRAHLLLGSLLLPVLRCEAQGLLGDVYPSHDDDRLNGAFVDLQSDQGRNLGPRHPRLRGHFLGGNGSTILALLFCCSTFTVLL